MIEKLKERSGNKCELCSGEDELVSFTVTPKLGEELSDNVALCNTCATQIANDDLDKNHFRCLTESIWSTEPAVQALSYRLLKKLGDEDTLSMVYLDEETVEWANYGGEDKIVHKDSNGHILEAGDTVVLIKDLNVKGANFTAKRGTAVRRIRLDPDNAEHIEGKVDGQQIVILTQYVKKS